MEARPAGYAGSGKGWVHRHEAKRAETRQLTPEEGYFIPTTYIWPSTTLLRYSLNPEFVDW
jgi:hypothetical protein